MNVTVLGIDLAKNVFQVHGVNQQGKVVLRRQLRRNQMSGSDLGHALASSSRAKSRDGHFMIKVRRAGSGCPRSVDVYWPG